MAISYRGFILHTFRQMAKSMFVQKVGYTAHCHTVQNPNAGRRMYCHRSKIPNRIPSATWFPDVKILNNHMQSSTNFPKIWNQFSNSRLQKGRLQQVSRCVNVAIVWRIMFDACKQIYAFLHVSKKKMQ
jgi:hypothetical protein